MEKNIKADTFNGASLTCRKKNLTATTHNKNSEPLTIKNPGYSITTERV